MADRRGKFLGKGFTNTEVYEAIDLDIFQIKPLDPKYIAERLIEGKLVGLFRGRSEYGPRALGNRTILCDPRKKENHEYINKKLKRNEIMPFAPIIMSEYISMEIDLEILDMLITDAAAGTEYWSAENNQVFNGTGFEDATSGFYNTQGGWFQTLGTKMQKLSNKIHQLTLRGGANF